MRIIHSGGFPEEERHQTRAVIFSNLVIAFKVLLDIMNSESIDFEHETTKVHFTLDHSICAAVPDDELINSSVQTSAELLEGTEPDVGSDEAFSDLRVRDAMRAMWNDAGVQKAVARGHEFALHDNLY